MLKIVIFSNSTDNTAARIEKMTFRDGSFLTFLPGLNDSFDLAHLLHFLFAKN